MRPYECARCGGYGFHCGTQYEPEWKHAAEAMIVCGNCPAGEDMMAAGEKLKALRDAEGDRV